MNIQQGLGLNDLSRNVEKIPVPSTPKAKAHQETKEDKYAETNEKYVEAYVEMVSRTGCWPRHKISKSSLSNSFSKIAAV